jgi:hypothetical protein
LKKIILFFILFVAIGCGRVPAPSNVPSIESKSDPDVVRRIASHRFPRLSNQLQLCCPDGNTKELLDQLYLWDLVVLEVELVKTFPEYLGAQGNIRTKNPDSVLLGVFSAGDILLSYNAPIHAGFHALVLPDWYLRDKAGKQIPLYELPNGEWSYAQNPTTRINHLLPDYLNRAVLSTGLFDGILYDWATTSISWLNHRNPRRNERVDIDNDEKGDSDQKTDRLWTEGFSKLLANSRISFPPGALILGNGGWNNGFDYAPHLNGLMVEQFLEGRKWNRKRFGWGSVMRTYAYYQSRSVHPNVSILMANDNEKRNFKSIRFALASTLMFDGYFSFSNRKGAYRVCEWFDEYSVSLETGKAERDIKWKGYLGKPLRPAFSADDPSELLWEALANDPQSAEKKVWRRDFENGVVLVNPGRTVTIPLHGQFRKISGTLDPAFNDGSLITEIQLPSDHGAVLLTTPK